MNRLNLFLYAMLLAFPLFASAESEKPLLPPESRPHKVVFHVSDEEPKKWHLTVNNATNVLSYLGKDNVAMEIVAYGPAIGMLKFESEAGPGLQNLMEMGAKVIACERTMHGDHLMPDDMLPEIGYTHTGVAYLMEKQKQGYAYIRP